MRAIIAVIVFIVGFVGFVSWAVIHDHRIEEANARVAYQTWLKLGGPTNVTYSEWRAYVLTTQPKPSTTIVPMPIYIPR